MPGRIGGLPAGIFDYRGQLAAEDVRAFAPRTLLNSPTGWLNRLHCHVTRLKPGTGYAPHIDNYDVAIVMLAGKVETIGQVLRPAMSFSMGRAKCTACATSPARQPNISFSNSNVNNKRSHASIFTHAL